MPQTATTRHTALLDWHRRRGARLVDFAGWRMPVHYSGVLAEHRAVRERVGLFDVSHMGEISVRGSGAEAFLQWLTPNDVVKLRPGRAHYSALLNEAGAFIDDLLLYRFDSEVFLLVVNAANVAADLEWIRSHLRGAVSVEDASAATALLALQGPRSASVLAQVVSQELDALSSFGFFEGAVAGVDGFVSRTGYTGEDGFEIYVPVEAAVSVWESLLAAGSDDGVLPVGLAARDTLRLEAGLMLHGNDIGPSTTPLEAGLGWVVKLHKGDFVGRRALLRQKEEGVARRLIGFELSGRRIARQGAPLFDAGKPVGTVTSGTWSPTLGKAIGMALVAVASADRGSELEVQVRGKNEPVRAVGLPFYRRPTNPNRRHRL